MKEYNKYVREWQDLCIRLNEAMQKDDFNAADKLMRESIESYNKYKECCSYPKSNRERTFGELNYMLESELIHMFNGNKKALKECTLLIKEDNNLRNAFRFIDALRKYNCDGESQRYVPFFSSTSSVCLVVCFPLPILSLRAPTSKPASGASRFIMDDFPTPEGPARIVVLPSNTSLISSIPSLFRTLINITFTPDDS